MCWLICVPASEGMGNDCERGFSVSIRGTVEGCPSALSLTLRPVLESAGPEPRSFVPRGSAAVCRELRLGEMVVPLHGGMWRSAALRCACLGEVRLRFSQAALPCGRSGPCRHEALDSPPPLASGLDSSLLAGWTCPVAVGRPGAAPRQHGRTPDAPAMPWARRLRSTPDGGDPP